MNEYKEFLKHLGINPMLIAVMVEKKIYWR